MSLAVVGAQFDNKRGPTRIFEINLCRPGEPIELRPEPSNPADPRAVAVYSCRGVQMGYLSAERCGRIGALICEGRELQAVFQEQTHYGAVIRVAFDGEVPAVSLEDKPRPAIRTGRQRLEPDFYPDEVWPDD
jgi:hypothetical protein